MSIVSEAPPAPAVASDLTVSRPKAADEPDHLLYRLIAFTVLVVAAHAWVIAHFQWALAILVLVDSAAAVFAGLRTVLTKGQVGRIRVDARDALFFALRTPCLLIASAVLFIAANLVGTVIVMAGGATGLGDVKLISESGKERGKEEFRTADALHHFHVYASPFGRGLAVQVKNFERYPFDLYPWIPKRIRVAADMRIAPSLLLRIPPAIKGDFAGPTLELRSGEDILLSVQPQEGQMAFLLGPERRLPESFVPAWQRYIKRIGLAESNAVTIDEWMTPENVPIADSFEGELTSGMQLCAQVVEGEDVLAQTKFTLTSESIQDVLITPCDSCKTKDKPCTDASH